MLDMKEKIKRMFPNLTGLWNLHKHKQLVYKSIREPVSMKESEYPNYLERFYERRTGHQLNLDNPQRFTEKVQWRKLNDRDVVYSLLSDKYRVREWVEKKIGNEYLVPLLGCWNHFYEIDFDTLPQQFVLKTNNGCHSNIIVKDKTAFLREKWLAQRKMEYWLCSDFFYDGLELHYRDIRPVIIAEKLLKPEAGEDCLTDYKIHCFDGTPFVCQVIKGRATKETLDFYDTEWKHLDLAHPAFPNSEKTDHKPSQYNQMLSIASKLSQGLKYVRVDLYNTENRVYFGEMTFTPASGTERYIPDQWDYIMGDQWDIHSQQVNHSVVMDF